MGVVADGVDGVEAVLEGAWRWADVTFFVFAVPVVTLLAFGSNNPCHTAHTALLKQNFCIFISLSLWVSHKGVQIPQKFLGTPPTPAPISSDQHLKVSLVIQCPHRKGNKVHMVNTTTFGVAVGVAVGFAVGIIGLVSPSGLLSGLPQRLSFFFQCRPKRRIFVL